MHDDLNALQKRLEAARLERTRAEGAEEHARQVAQAAKDDLKREFDVDTTEQAEELLGQLRTQLTSQIAKIAAQLDEIGVA